MLSENFEPYFPIKLLTKDINYTIEIAGRRCVDTHGKRRACLAPEKPSRSSSALNMTAIVKLFENR